MHICVTNNRNIRVEIFQNPGIGTQYDVDIIIYAHGNRSQYVKSYNIINIIFYGNLTM